MITDLWIENFKGIGKRQHIPLRPVTLLFGANSAGKSTVLHALMYLREVFCNRNLDPTRPIDGENTVNLGGIRNLARKVKAADDRESADSQPEKPITIGCRLTIDPDRQSPHDVPSDRHYYRSFISHLYRSNRFLSMPSSSQFSESVSETYTCEVWITICPMLRKIVSIRLNINGENLFTSLLDRHCNQHFYWINPFHSKIQPRPGNEDGDPWASLLERRVRLTRSILQRSGMEPFEVISEAFKNKLVWLESPNEFQFSKPPHYSSDAPLSVLALTEVQEGALRFVRLDQLLRDASYRVVDERTDVWVNSSSQVMVGFSIRPLEDEIASDIPYLSCVAMPKALEEHAYSILRHIRLATTGVTIADRFDATERGGWLSDDRPILDFYLDELGGGLLDESDEALCWLPEQLGLVDSLVRSSLRQFRRCLSEVCYVGPKRAALPRNLNESVLDEYSRWGNGLAAWRWLLSKSDCPDTVFSACSMWLSDAQQGVGTGYQLRREGVYLLTPEQLTMYYNDQFDLDADSDQMQYSSRIELFDLRSGVVRHPQDVGEGITQLVPVIAACIRASIEYADGQFVAIEQPELHLHPSLAARVGDLLVCCSGGDHSDRRFCLPPVFLIETHSEHVILRILRRIRQTTNDELPEHIPPVEPDDVCVLWVDNLGDGTTYQRLRIDDQGEFIDRWPRGFFSERAEELY